jgi:hypothetical protein
MHYSSKLCNAVDRAITHAGYAQAGQITNNIQIPILNDQSRRGGILDFGQLVIGDYLEFGIWILGFRCLFVSGYAELRKGGFVIYGNIHIQTEQSSRSIEKEHNPPGHADV